MIKMDIIDFVILWVDGNDPEWRKEKEKYDNTASDDREVRYRDWDNLQYWFRGVEKFAPWVDKIHFVTYGHLPKWLNRNNKKLNIVNHKDFMPQGSLPVFNSNAIEVNLHRIKGLADHFVYFNDDFFIINKVKKEDFFINGIPCDSAIMSPIIQENKNGIGNILTNNVAIINEFFNKKEQISKKITNWFNFKYGIENIKNLFLLPWHDFKGFYEVHIANSYLKKTFKEVWEKNEKELTATTFDKFRNPRTDVNQWVFRDWQIASNNIVPRNIRFGHNFKLEESFDEAIKAIINQKYKIISLNDSNNINDFEEKKEKVVQAFNKILPEKSSFEL